MTDETETSLELRRMTERDLPDADNLRRLIGWNQTMADWQRMLGLEPEGCFVALRGGKLVGTVTTIVYGRELAWIGMMIVHPDQRRQGIATSLMCRALDFLRSRSIACIRLDATPAGYPVYEKLGFVPEWTLTRWQRSASEHPSGNRGPNDTRPLREPDWRSVEKIDFAAFGVPRLSLLRSLAKGARAVRVWPGQNTVAGWGMLRPGANADYLGPIVCLVSDGVRPLVAAMLENARPASVIWDIPDDNSAPQALAEEFGFSPIRKLTRMRLGPSAFATCPRTLFAIADPAVG